VRADAYVYAAFRMQTADDLFGGQTDRDVLEAVIDLTHEARSLPIGLRVTVQFLSSRVPKR
jgi:hypothetical protein